MFAARPITGSSHLRIASASFAVHTCPPPACDRLTNRPAVRPVRKNSLSDTWWPKTNESSARKSECTLEIRMFFDHQSLLSSTQRGSQPAMSNGKHHFSAHTIVAQRDSHAPLVPCVYIALLCSHCGDLRQALAALPDSEITVCPECARACAFVLLGSGLTKRALPFHEIRPAEQTRWDHRSDETDDDS
jgi:hypothetical protein